MVPNKNYWNKESYILDRTLLEVTFSIWKNTEENKGENSESNFWFLDGKVKKEIKRKWDKKNKQGRKGMIIGGRCSSGGHFYILQKSSWQYRIYTNLENLISPRHRSPCFNGLQSKISLQDTEGNISLDNDMFFICITSKATIWFHIIQKKITFNP